ncbi:MAG: exosome complex RNA-binding protein Csl4 [Candidatus Diapherotrites archaeon]
MKKDDLVVPGNFLANEEEFMAGSNAFEDDEGNVYADSVGIKKLDSDNHEASVEKFSRSVKIIERGCIIHGRVSMVKTSAVLVEVISAEKDGENRTVHNRNASLVISNIADAYVDSIDTMYRVGDIIRARVLDVTSYSIELGTKEEEFGVVKAYGIRSRKPLVLIDNKLRDTVTGDVEERKISSLYALR